MIALIILRGWQGVKRIYRFAYVETRTGCYTNPLPPLYFKGFWGGVPNFGGVRSFSKSPGNLVAYRKYSGSNRV